MRLPKCIYFQAGVAPDPGALNEFHNQMWAALDGKIDGYNLAASLAGEGLFFSVQTQVAPRVLSVPIADSKSSAYIRKKGASVTATATKQGLEIVVDASSSLYGRMCILDKDYLSSQLISMVPDDPASVANPGGTYRTPLGAMTFDTGGAFDVIAKRNAIEMLRLDGTGVLVTASMRPDDTNTRDIGTSSLAWKELYVRTIDTDGENDLTLQRNNQTQITLNGTDVYVGDGVTDATPLSMSIRGTGGSGANVAGATLTMSGGQSTGSGAAGNIVFSTAIAGGAGSSLNALIERVTIYGSATGIVVNETGEDYDFRIEGDTSVNLFFVDASTNRVGVNTGAPGTTLDVNGKIKGATSMLSPLFAGFSASTTIQASDEVTATLLVRGADGAFAPGAVTIRGGDASDGSTGGALNIRPGTSASGTKGTLALQGPAANSAIRIDGTGLGFFEASPAAQQTVTGSRGANAALASLLSALNTIGLLVDSSTA